MPEQPMLTVPQVARRWKCSAQDILERGLRRGVDIWFAFEGLVFEEGDTWRPAGGDAPDMAELRRLREFIKHSEQKLHQARVSRKQSVPVPTPEEVGKIQRDIAQAKRDGEDLRARLRGRNIMHDANTFRGYLRLPPAILYALHQHGKAAHPVVAFWHVGEIRVIKGSDGKPMLEGPVVTL